MMLGVKGRPFSSELVRHYQKQLLALPNGDECLIELLPLPSKSIGHRLYMEHSTLGHLANRYVYWRHYQSLAH